MTITITNIKKFTGFRQIADVEPSEVESGSRSGLYALGRVRWKDAGVIHVADASPVGGNAWQPVSIVANGNSVVGEV